MADDEMSLYDEILEREKVKQDFYSPEDLGIEFEAVEPPAADPNAPSTPKAYEPLRIPIVSDVADFGVDVAKGITRGAIKFGESIAELEASAMNLPIQAYEKITGKDTGFRFKVPKGDDTFSTDPILRGDGFLADDTMKGQVIESLTQFGIGWYTGGQALNSLKWARSGKQGIDFARATTQGAIADFTAFSSDEERLADLMVTFDSPILNNGLTQYLASDPSDSMAEARFKNVLEGGIVGVGLEGAYLVAKEIIPVSARGIRDARYHMKAGNPEAAKEALDISRAEVKKIMEDNAEAIEAELVKTGADESAAPLKRTTRAPIGKQLNDLTFNEAEFKDAMEQIKYTKTLEKWSPKEFKEVQSKLNGRINTEQFEKTDDILVLMEEMSEIKPPEFKTWPWEEQVEMAKMYGTTVDELKVIADKGLVNSDVMIKSKMILQEQATVLDRMISEGMPDDQILIEMNKYSEIYGIFSTFSNVAGRTLDSTRIKTELAAGSRDAIDSFITERFGGKKGFDKFKEAWAATENMAEKNALMKMSKGRIAADSVLELWKNSILSGLRTFNVNLMGGIANTYLQIPIRTFEGISGALRNADGERVYIGESMAMMMADVTAMKETLNSAYRLSKNPNRFKDFKVPHSLRDKTELGPTRKISSDYWGIKTTPGATARLIEKNFGIAADSTQELIRKSVDVTGSVINTPGNLLNIQDGFIQNHAKRQQKFALAYRQMMQEGTPKKDWGKRFNQLLNDDIFNEGIQGQLDDYAKRVTFQTEMGDLGKSVDRIARSRFTPMEIPVLEYLMPFRRTPANIFKQGVVEVNPAFAPLTKDFHRKIAEGGISQDEALGRVAFGGTVATLTAMQVMEGNITGAGPQDPKMREAWLRAGNKPYSMKVQIGEDANGNAIYESYEYGRVEPLAFLIGSIATAMETHHYARMIDPYNDKDEFKEYAAGMIAAMGEATLDKSFFTGVQEFFQLADDPTRYMDTWTRRFGSSFVPNIARDVGTMMEEHAYLRDVQSMEEAIKVKLGPNERGEVPVVRNLWGDPIAKDPGWFFGARSHFSPIGMSDGYAEDIDREITRLAIDGVKTDTGVEIFKKALLPMPERDIMGVKLDNFQYSRLLEIAGHEVKIDKFGVGQEMTKREALNYLVNESEAYRAALKYPATQAQMIRDVWNGYDDVARELLRDEDADLERKIRNREGLKMKQHMNILEPSDLQQLLENLNDAP